MMMVELYLSLNYSKCLDHDKRKLYYIERLKNKTPRWYNNNTSNNINQQKEKDNIKGYVTF